MESTIHPHFVKVGDKLTIIYKNDEIEVTVISEPYEEWDIDEGDGCWFCGIKWEAYLNDWYAVWSYRNRVWEIVGE
jgi:hypothetical protein